METPGRQAWARRPGMRRHRRFAAWLSEADMRDNERMRLVLAATLESDSNCIDVGAATGDFVADMMRLAPSAHHIAYEPVPELFERLKQRFPDLDARNTAVSDVSGEATFTRVQNAPGWSSLRDYDDIGGADKQVIPVRTVRLDDDLPTDFVPKCIKIDVNGAELGVFLGALETLKRHRPYVLFEHGRAARSYGTTPSMIFDVLCSRCDLRIFELDGRGPLTEASFCEAVESRWNFLAK